MNQSSKRLTKALLSPVKRAAVDLADQSGHGKAFVISYPDKLLTTPYWKRQISSNSSDGKTSPNLSTYSFLDYAKHANSTSTTPTSSGIGLYLHLPFCEQKCSYCNFAVSTNDQEDYQTAYLDRLLRDVEMFLRHNQSKIHSIDIGGGTPMLLSVTNLEKLSKFLAPIVSSIENYNPTKFSFEQTSKIATLNPEKMAALISALPMNQSVRTSMGIQSISAEVLNRYKRQSTNLGSEKSPTEQCRHHLPTNSHISADLIFPLGKEDDFIETIKKTIHLEFDTITAYDMIDSYGGGIRKAFNGLATFPKESYGKFYDIFYHMMIDNGYILRYGSNNAIKKSTLDRYLHTIHGITSPSSVNIDEYLDYASRYAVSHYYHDRISLGNEFIGFGVGSSSKLMNRDMNRKDGIQGNEYVWSFYHPNVSDWMSRRSSSMSLDSIVPFSYSYQFPREIWITKDIRYQLANCGCINFDWLQQKYPYSQLQSGQNKTVMGEFQREIDFVLEQGWMEWKGTNQLCLIEGQYQYLAHIRALFSDSLLLNDIVNLYTNREYLDKVYSERQVIERIYQQSIQSST